MKDAQRPLVTPGDMVLMKDVIQPVGRPAATIKHTGVYDRVGYPKIPPGISSIDVRRRLQKNCRGVVTAGDTCLVIAVSFCESDGKWYYLLNNGKPKGFGWTRCSFRFEKL